MGYLSIDDRAAGGKHTEYDTVSCKHCQAVIRVVHRQPQGAWCLQCQGPVCDTPACASRCVPFFLKIEAAQARERLWAAVTNS